MARTRRVDRISPGSRRLARTTSVSTPFVVALASRPGRDQHGYPEARGDAPQQVTRTADPAGQIVLDHGPRSHGPRTTGP